MSGVFGPLWLPCLICFCIGAILFVTELFLPGFGVAGIGGFLCFAAVIAMQFFTNSSVLTASIVSLVTIAIMIALFVIFMQSMKHGLLFRSPIVLKDKVESVSSPIAQENGLIGKSGVTVTPLRPCGTALIEGKRYTVRTDATFVEQGKTVTVTAVDGLNIVVA